MAAKSARLEVRLTPEHRDLIEQAASTCGLSVADFVLTRSLSEARKAIGEDQVIKLSRADQIHFAEAMLNPKPPTRGLKNAFKAHRDLIQQ